MSDRNRTLERFVSSFWFSLILFALWSVLTVTRSLPLWERFSITEFVWVLHHATVSVLLLIRTRPTAVSVDPVHWLVALGASFSGLLFEQSSQTFTRITGIIARVLIYGGLLLSATVTYALGRSYDFVPAVRRIKTGWLYGWVRHPMYAMALTIRIGYWLRHPSWQNGLVLVGAVVLYAVRARFEETLLSKNPDYRAYAQRVPARFIPNLI